MLKNLAFFFKKKCISLVIELFFFKINNGKVVIKRIKNEKTIFKKKDKNKTKLFLKISFKFLLELFSKFF